MKVLKFSQPSGPIYHYSPATNITFGDQPFLRDPLAKKYLYVKNYEKHHIITPMIKLQSYPHIVTRQSQILHF